MARVPQTQRFLGWFVATVGLSLCLGSGCVIVEKDGDNVGGNLTPPPTTPADPTGAARQVFTLVNEARSQPRACGARAFDAAPPLRWNDRLAQAAQGHSDDMAAHGYFDHTSRDGRTFDARISAQGYVFSTVGENIAAGQMTPAEVMKSWLESPGHCANIMSPGFEEIGVGRAEGGNLGLYWTQNFGSPP
jgi:uncharacterized protein YkwD